MDHWGWEKGTFNYHFWHNNCCLLYLVSSTHFEISDFGSLLINFGLKVLLTVCCSWHVIFGFLFLCWFIVLLFSWASAWLPILACGCLVVRFQAQQHLNSCIYLVLKSYQFIAYYHPGCKIYTTTSFICLFLPFMLPTLFARLTLC